MIQLIAGYRYTARLEFVGMHVGPTEIDSIWFDLVDVQKKKHPYY